MPHVGNIPRPQLTEAQEEQKVPGQAPTFEHVLLLGNIFNGQLGQWPQTIASYHDLQELLVDVMSA